MAEETKQYALLVIDPNAAVEQMVLEVGTVEQCRAAAKQYMEDIDAEFADEGDDRKEIPEFDDATSPFEVEFRDAELRIIEVGFMG